MATQTALPNFLKFHQFSKLEDSKDNGMPTVWGVATWEKPDSDSEVCDYETAVPVYQAWSAKAFKRTSNAGQEPSLGNVRLQHGSDVGGKATKLEFNDGEKEIWLGSEPINEEVRSALKGGFYTGYSQGGSYAWRACDKCTTPLPLQQGNNYCPKCDDYVTVRYGLRRLAEVSYVDSPATGEGFEHVKANGSVEILKFAKREDIPVKKAPREETVVKTAREKALVTLKAAIAAKLKADGLDEALFEKGLYTVSRFAEMLESMSRLWESAVYEREIEGDASDVPDELRELLDSMIGTFIAMATEEARELSAKKTSTGEKAMTPEELAKQQELEKAAKKSLASHFAKAASHHEKLADRNEKLAEIHSKAAEGCKDCMGKADTAKAAKVEAMKAEAVAKGEVYKEDVGSGAHEGDVHEVLACQVEFHKAASAEHGRIAKAHDKHAEHLHKMAESHDEETAKAVKAEIAAFDAANPEAVVKTETKTVPTMDEDVAKAAEAQRQSPEYKKAISDIAQAHIDAELAEKRSKIIVPDGVKIGDTIKGATIVPRDQSTKLVLTPSSTGNELPGL